MSVSRTSMDFGNVVVGSISTQIVTLSNSGNGSLTVSPPQVTGSDFSVNGLMFPLKLGPGQPSNLSVEFTPMAVSSATGSISITSDASTSPVRVNLSGSGFTPPSGLLACGTFGDSSNHMPTDWTAFVPPGKGQSYVDPTFGCTVTRVTDSSNEITDGSTFFPINQGYATVSPFNANDSMLLLEDGRRKCFVTDLSGNIVVPIANMPPSNNTWFLWDAANPNVFYYTMGNSLMKGAISGSAVTPGTVHQFSEYAAINFMDETDVSEDGAHVVIVGGDTSGSSPEDVFVYDFVANTKGTVYTTGCAGSVGGPNNACLHKLIQTPDNNVIIQFASDGTGLEQGNRVWTGVAPLAPLQDKTNHLDTGYDMNGNPIFVEVGNSSVLTTLVGITNPCPSGWGLDVRMIYNPLSAVCLIDNPPQYHVGYRGNPQQPWVGLSFFDNRNPSPEWFDTSGSFVAPAASNWLLYEDELLLVRIDANNGSNLTYRLARAYSRSNEDFYAQPHAAISRDGHYVAFVR